jgi:hypothetical protein
MPQSSLIALVDWHLSVTPNLEDQSTYLWRVFEEIEGRDAHLKTRSEDYQALKQRIEAVARERIARANTALPFALSY